MIIVLIFVNGIFLIGLAVEAPHILFIVVRVFGGALIALIAQINKGFVLYDDLDPDDFKAGRDSEFLYFTRLFFLGFLMVFTGYMLVSFCCFCCIGGVDGGNLRNVRDPNKRFKRVPFGDLVFAEGHDCAICMERFHESHKVVKLACHNTHVFHRSCLASWVRGGHSDCPLCRRPIA